jgi:hypothetical protein
MEYTKEFISTTESQMKVFGGVEPYRDEVLSVLKDLADEHAETNLNQIAHWLNVLKFLRNSNTPKKLGKVTRKEEIEECLSTYGLSMEYIKQNFVGGNWVIAICLS